MEKENERTMLHLILCVIFLRRADVIKLRKKNKKKERKDD